MGYFGVLLVYDLCYAGEYFGGLDEEQWVIADEGKRYSVPNPRRAAAQCSGRVLTLAGTQDTRVPVEQVAVITFNDKKTISYIKSPEVIKMGKLRGYLNRARFDEDRGVNVEAVGGGAGSRPEELRGVGMEERYMLELRGVSRRISSEFYLRGINLALRPGEVHALVGRNASGKSTLFSTIMGVFTPDRGQVLIDGQPAEIRNTSDAVKNGLILVAQHQQMFANLPVYENLFFGNELRMGGKLGLVDNRRMLHRCEEVFRQMNVQIDPPRADGQPHRRGTPAHGDRPARSSPTADHPA